MQHCDDVIDDVSAQPSLREFIRYHRLPAMDQLNEKRRPQLFAKTVKTIHNESGPIPPGTIVRVTTASRFGDVGITLDHNQEYGYAARVFIDDLAQFTNDVMVLVTGEA